MTRQQVNRYVPSFLPEQVQCHILPTFESLLVVVRAPKAHLYHFVEAFVLFLTALQLVLIALILLQLALGVDCALAEGVLAVDEFVKDHS